MSGQSPGSPRSADAASRDRHPLLSRRHLLDPLAVARAAKAPASGPRIVFFSGGSALGGLSRALTRYTHNSVHLITPFDSGGSSAGLRSAFDMPAVGDLRSRLLALADDERGHLRRPLQRRLPKSASAVSLRRRLDALADGQDPLLAEIPESERRRLCAHLERLARALPAKFDLRGASIGNLVLAGSYLEHGSIADAVADLGSLLKVRGRVLASCDANLHLIARLADGSEVVGQHRITGKQHVPLQSRIESLSLATLGSKEGSKEGSDGGPDATPRHVVADAAPAALSEIRRADLVCYPMGSFYSSVLCNVLLRGVGGAILDAPCPKVYVPSTGRDPELVDTDVAEAACLLVRALSRDRDDAKPGALLDAVLLNDNAEVYETPPDLRPLDALGIEHIPTELVTPNSHPDIDSDRLAQVLVSLAARERDTEENAP